MSWGRVAGRRVLELGMPGEQRQRLLALVLAGQKTGTAGRYQDYLDEGEPLEHVGELLTLVDDEGHAVAVVQVVSAQVERFDDVSDDFARSEGEGFGDHAGWAVAHRRFWEGAGDPVSGETAVVCLRFQLADARQ